MLKPTVNRCAALFLVLVILSFSVFSLPISADGPELTGLILNRSSLSMHLGDSETLTVSPFPETATLPTLTWTSDDNSIASVSEATVTAHAVGTAVITVSDGGSITATCSVTVSEEEPVVTLTALSLGTQILDIPLGNNKTFQPQITPSNCRPTLTWSVRDTSIATVNENGIVTPIRAGYSILTVSCGSISASCPFVVYDPAHPTVQWIGFSDASMTLNVGVSKTVPLVHYPVSATPSCTYASDNTAVAVVTENGSVTGVSVGSASITVTCGTLTQTISVQVKERATTDIKLNYPSASLYAGHTFRLEIKSPENLSIISCKSKDENIAMAYADGQVNGIAIGKTQIVVTASDGSTAVCELRVVDPNVRLTGFSLSHTALTLAIGESQKLTPVFQPSGASDCTVSYSSNDDAIATVGADGTVMAMAIGTTTIIARAYDYSASCKVTVSDTGEISAEPWRGKIDTSWYSAEQSEYHISDFNQLAGLASLVNSGNTFAGKTVMLDSDIAFGSGSAQFTRIGTRNTPFSGIFDGQGHAVIGIHVVGDSCGLFGCCESAVIRNLRLSSSAMEGETATGLIVGYATLTEIGNCTASGSVTGKTFCGGLVGFAERCVVFSSSFSGKVTGTLGCGGIVGLSDLTVLINLTASGTVSGTERCGGLVGALISSDLENVSVQSTVSGTRLIGGAVGYASLSNLSLCACRCSVSGDEKVGSVLGGIGEYVFGDAVWYVGTTSDTYFTSLADADEMLAKITAAYDKRHSDLLAAWTNDSFPAPGRTDSFPTVTVTDSEASVSLSSNGTTCPMEYAKLIATVARCSNTLSRFNIRINGSATEFSPLFFSLLCRLGEENKYSVSVDGTLTVLKEKEGATPYLSLSFGALTYTVTALDLKNLAIAYDSASSTSDLASYYTFRCENKTEEYQGKYDNFVSAYYMAGYTEGSCAWFLDCTDFLKPGEMITVVYLYENGTYTSISTGVSDYTAQGGSTNSLRIPAAQDSATCFIFRSSEVPAVFSSGQTNAIPYYTDSTPASVYWIAGIAGFVLLASVGVIIWMVIRRRNMFN